MSNSSELLSYTTTRLGFKLIHHYFLSNHVHRPTDTQTDRHTPRHRDGHEYSIVAVDKLQLSYLCYLNALLFLNVGLFESVNARNEFIELTYPKIFLLHHQYQVFFQIKFMVF